MVSLKVWMIRLGDMLDGSGTYTLGSDTLSMGVICQGGVICSGIECLRVVCSGGGTFTSGE